MFFLAENFSKNGEVYHASWGIIKLQLHHHFLIVR